MIALNRQMMGGMLAGLLLCFPAPRLGGQALDPEPAPPPPANQPVPPLRAFPTPAVPPTVRTRPASQYPPPQQTVVRPPTTPAFAGTPPNALAWESELVQLTAPPDASNILVTFSFTNVHTSEVVIKSVRPSCGCTTVQLPALPWRIPPGGDGQITANLDLRGKRGVLTKTLTIDSTSGFKSLVFKVTVPAQLVTTTASGESIDPERLKNMQMAMVDRQVIFKSQECVECHLTPAVGKMGEELYNAACAICHDAPTRATMVPDLKALRYPTSAPYWKYWITNGRPGSLMPGFHQKLGGPLDDEQIQSLVDFLTQSITLKNQPAAASQVRPAAKPIIRAPASPAPAPKPAPAPVPAPPPPSGQQ